MTREVNGSQHYSQLLITGNNHLDINIYLVSETATQLYFLKLFPHNIKQNPPKRSGFKILLLTSTPAPPENQP